MRRYSATITRKGQVTVPVDIRRRLGLENGGKVEILLDDAGHISLARPTFSSLEEIIGIAGTLARPMEWDEMRSIAIEDALAEKYGASADA